MLPGAGFFSDQDGSTGHGKTSETIAAVHELQRNEGENNLPHESGSRRPLGGRRGPFSVGAGFQFQENSNQDQDDAGKEETSQE